ncbi:MAG: hypothetical protein M9950_10965 [Thermomicrobiales bacterium]|nr:hypothetical protein [Thermomicrobiales bacterium]
MSDNTPKPKPQLPPHMQRLVRDRNIDDPQAAAESRRAALERRRMAIQFDIDQGELAQEPENPWTHRIVLLTEALANVESEIQAARVIGPQPYVALPSIAIEDVAVSEVEPYEVSFRIGAERFRWQEKLDWIERGGILAQPVLEQVGGSAAAIVPENVAGEFRDDLQTHLSDSLNAYATMLRDARLNEETLPLIATYDQLLPPCPTCGGWMDVKGHCNACAARKVHEQDLLHERQHLMKERSAEAEERHRLAERLPLARKRMADLERELASLM